MGDNYEMDAAEKFWIGPSNPELHTVYKLQSLGSEWLTLPTGLELDPTYSEFSVRVHHPKARSLSFINKTIAILPKHLLREIHALIGEYLNEYDTEEHSK